MAEGQEKHTERAPSLAMALKPTSQAVQVALCSSPLTEVFKHNLLCT